MSTPTATATSSLAALPSLCRTATLPNPCCVSVTPPATSVLTWSSIRTRRARSSASPWRARATWMPTVLQMSRSDGADPSPRGGPDKSRAWTCAVAGGHGYGPGLQVRRDRSGSRRDVVNRRGPRRRRIRGSRGRRACDPSRLGRVMSCRAARWFLGHEGTVLTGEIAGAVFGQTSCSGDLNGTRIRRYVVGGTRTFSSSGQGSVTTTSATAAPSRAPGIDRGPQVSDLWVMRFSAARTIVTAMGASISSSARRSPTTRSELSTCSGADLLSRPWPTWSRSARFPSASSSLPRDGRRFWTATVFPELVPSVLLLGLGGADVFRVGSTCTRGSNRRSPDHWTLLSSRTVGSTTSGPVAEAPHPRPVRITATMEPRRVRAQTRCAGPVPKRKNRPEHQPALPRAVLVARPTASRSTETEVLREGSFF